MSLAVELHKKLPGFSLSVAFTLDEGNLSLLGASGSGKSMTLRCIAGIERPDSGKIVLNGRTLYDSAAKINLPPQRRAVGYLFQHYALFPHKTVRQNIVCGIKNRDELPALLDAFALTELADRRPHQLSGGQQQRVALARSLAAKPELLLLDEPFSALDGPLRRQTMQQVQERLDDYQKPVIFVSHDSEEAYRFSPRMAILHRGSVQMLGTREKVYAAPQTVAAARQIGCQNLSRIARTADGQAVAADWAMPIDCPIPAGCTYVGLHTEQLYQAESGQIPCLVQSVAQNPFCYTITALPKDGKQPLTYALPKTHPAPALNESVCLCFAADALLFLSE